MLREAVTRSAVDILLKGVGGASSSTGKRELRDLYISDAAVSFSYQNLIVVVKAVLQQRAHWKPQPV